MECQLASFQYGTTDERLEYVVRTLRRKANVSTLTLTAQPPMTHTQHSPPLPLSATLVVQELSARKSLMELMAPKKKGDTDGGSEASEAGDDPQPKT